jgi:hypothetical protein
MSQNGGGINTLVFEKKGAVAKPDVLQAVSFQRKINSLGRIGRQKNPLLKTDV